MPGCAASCENSSSTGGEDLLGSEHGAFAVVAPVLVPVSRIAPECFRGFVDILGENDHGAGREKVRQDRGPFEEQRQVILDSGWPSALTDFPVHRTTRRIAFEAPPPRAPERRYRGGGGRELAGGKEIDALDSVRGTLAVGVEDAQCLDLVVEQVDSERRGGAHRKDVQQRAAHCVLAVLHHLADTGVSRPVQALAERGDVQAVAARDLELVALDEAGRGDPRHRGRHRGHHDAGSERRQPPDGLQPFGDDVLMR